VTRPLVLSLAAVVLASATTTTGSALAAGGGTAAAGRSRALDVGSVSLLAGSTPRTRPFPDNSFTVADTAQRSGRRVSLPTAGCDAQGRSLCDDLALVNTLDGFDLQPRVTLPFSAAVDLLSVTPADVHMQDPAGRSVGGLVKLVFDPASNTVSGETDSFLAPDTTYTLVVSPGITALDGTLVDVCATGCAPGATSRQVPFTTMTSTSVLDGVRAALDDGSAYSAAGITTQQEPLDTKVADGSGLSVFTGVPPGNGPITRNDQTSADPAAALTTSGVIDTTGAAFKGFAGLMSPQYADANAVIPNVGTGSTPTPMGKATIGVSVMAAAKPVGGGCLRPVIFGPGFTRSKYDVFLSSDMLPTTGGSAVFATDPLGHSYGPRSTWTVMHGGMTTSGSGFGRGHDLDGNGKIGAAEGSQPSFQVDAQGVPVSPSPQALVGLRDSLIQTVIDNMVLVRALEKGVDLDGDGVVDTCKPTATDPHPVTYYGQSFGGIYGTMLLGTDPEVTVGVPNVPGGPIVDIARLSSFRGNIAAQLQANQPSLLNGGPGNNGFTESVPLRLDPRVTNPVPGAIAIQEYGALGAWVERAGSPETYAPALAAGGRFGSTKKVIFQTEYTDGTVPNPTANDIYRALGDYSRVWIYRNDRTATFASDPHGSLLDPTLDTRNLAQRQIYDYLTSDGATVTDPDAGANVVEQGNSSGTNYPVQLNCLHYPDPQTGMMQTRTMGSPDCQDLSGTVTTPQQHTTPVGGNGTPPAPAPPSSSAPGGGSGSTAAGTPTLTLRADHTFIRYGARQVFTGRLTLLGAPVGSARVTVQDRFSDGRVVPLGGTTTAPDGSWRLTAAPPYSGTVTAAGQGVTSTGVPSRVILTFRSVLLARRGNRVTVTAQTRPGFLTGPSRAERVQLVARVHGRDRVLTTATAGQRRPVRGEAHGVNTVRLAGALPAGATGLRVLVIGTPVNTGTSTTLRLPRPS